MKPLLTVVLILSCFFCFSQTTAWSHKRDSLFKQLDQRVKEDTNRARTLFNIGRLYSYSNFDSSLLFLQRAEELSKKIKFDYIYINTISMKGVLLSYQKKWPEAMATGAQAIDLALKFKDPVMICVVYTNACTPYGATNDYAKAIELTLKAMHVAEGIADSIRLTSIYCNLGYFYENLKDHKSAYEYDLKSVVLSRKKNTLTSLEVALLNTSNPLLKEKKYDSAIIVLKEALTLAEQNNDKIYYSVILNNLILNYRLAGQNEKTKPLVEELIKKAMADGSTDGLILALDNKGDYFINRKEYDSAFHYYQRSLDTSFANKVYTYLEDAYRGMTDVMAARGKFEEYEKYRDLRDSVKDAAHADEVIKNTQDQETKYGAEKKQIEIDNLNKAQRIQQLDLRQRKTTIWILAGIAIFISLVSFLSYRSYRNRKRLLLSEAMLQQQRIVELENEKLLSATQAIVQGQEEERTRLAKDLHDGLGGILSSTKYSLGNMKQNFIVTPENADAFERTMAMMDQSITELRRVAHNMMPETLMKLSLDEALQDYCLQVTNSGALPITYQSAGMQDLVVENTVKTTVYRIVQELTNNIIKHAAASKALVQVIAKDNMLNITVEDDGKGFDVNALQFASGIGYKNAKSRIEFLKGKIDVQSKYGEGSSFYIEIPLG